MHASIQTASPPRGGNNLALSVVGALFFMLGFITCLNDILIPHLKAIFNLNYTQAMLVQFCFFTAYAVMSIPMSKLVEKMGYFGVGNCVAASGGQSVCNAVGTKGQRIGDAHANPSV